MRRLWIVHIASFILTVLGLASTGVAQYAQTDPCATVSSISACFNTVGAPPTFNVYGASIFLDAPGIYRYPANSYLLWPSGTQVANLPSGLSISGTFDFEHIGSLTLINAPLLYWIQQNVASVSSTTTYPGTLPVIFNNLNAYTGFTVLIKYWNTGTAQADTSKTQIFASVLDTNGNEAFTLGKRGTSFVIGRHIANANSAISPNIYYFDSPWEPRDVLPNNASNGLASSQEFAYFTFLTDGKLRIDRFRFDSASQNYDWEEGVSDDGFPTTGNFASATGNNNAAYQDASFTGIQMGPLGQSSKMPLPQAFPDGLQGVSVFPQALSVNQILAWQTKEFSLGSSLLLNMMPCNTGLFLPSSSGNPAPGVTVATPCGQFISPPTNTAYIPQISSDPIAAGSYGYTQPQNVQNAPVQTPPPPRRHLLGAEDDSYLHVNGALLLTKANHTVTLRGVNLGGWLVQESWMDGELTPDLNFNANSATDSKCPGNPAAANTNYRCIQDRFILERLETRFGTAQGDSLIALWEQNFITDADFAQISSAGFNVVRVPFSWRNLQHEDGTWIVDSQGNIDFSLLDFVVTEAAKYRLYVIFDLHVWQGQQGSYGNIVANTTNADLVHAAAIWSTMAEHFQGNGTVAGFDLLNEVPPTSSQVWQVLYNAVRSQDPERVLFVERGKYSWLNDIDPTTSQIYRNLVYSAHLYNFDDATVPFVQNAFNSNPGGNDIPIQGNGTWPTYIGEFKTEPATTSWILDAMGNAGWSWTPWTWKGVNVGGWAMVDYHPSASTVLKNGSSPIVDVTDDSYQAITTAWTTGLSASNASSQQSLLSAYSAGATHLPSPSSGGPAGFSYCASDGGTCNAGGPASIAYGANASFYYLTAPTGILSCGVKTFGDPDVGAAKTCYYSLLPTGPAGGPAGFSLCSNEGGYCAFSGSQLVAFGAGTAFAFQNLSDGTSCSTGVFGDPNRGVYKACYVLLASNAPVPPPNGTFCAPQGQQCNFNGTQVVAYGNAPFFSYVTASSPLNCTPATFQNFGTTSTNACFLVSNTPVAASGYTYCGVADSGCQFNGVADVIYQKANGTQYTSVQQNGFVCNPMALGILDYSAFGDYCFYKLNAADAPKVPTMGAMIGNTGPVLMINLITSSIMIDAGGTAGTPPNMVKQGSQSSYPVWLINWIADNHYTIASGVSPGLVLTAQPGTQNCSVSSICGGIISEQPYVAGQLNQVWQIVFTPRETAFVILNQATGLVLDTSQNNNGDAGALSQPHTWNGFPWAHNQAWQFISAINDVSPSCSNKASAPLLGTVNYQFMFVNTSNANLATFSFVPLATGSISVGNEISDTCSQGTIFPNQSCYFTVPVTSSGPGSGQLSWKIDSTWYDPSLWGQLFGISQSKSSASICQNFTTR